MEKPKTIVEAETFLRDNLIGETFPKQYQSIVGNYVLQSSLRPGPALEDLTYTLLRRRFKAAKVQHEPLGFETFPDLMLSFGNRRSTYYFEVKSKTLGGNRDVALASLKQLAERVQAGDPTYFETYFLFWTFEETPTSITVRELEMGQLWQVAGLTADGAVKNSASGAGRTRYLNRGSRHAKSQHEFGQALVQTFCELKTPSATMAKIEQGMRTILEQF